MISEELEKDIFSFLDQVGRKEILDGSTRVLNLQNSQKWGKIIKEVVGIDCIPYLLLWDGTVYAYEIGRNLTIMPERGIIVPGTKTYKDIIEGQIQAEKDISTNAFMKTQVRDFKRWKNKNKDVKLTTDEVAGLIIPITLGGKEIVNNRQVIDAEVYFTMTWEISQ